jgi:tRNA threonylcarbamoyladenosine biosynthesis protein TsaE
MNATGRTTRSPEETERLGEALAPALSAGDVLALSGPLGAGKTRFVAGLARGLACKARVRSPTYALLNEYHGRVLLAHLDLFRLDPDEVEALDLDLYAGTAVLAVEWGERLPDVWRAEALRLEFAKGATEEERRITATADGGRGLALREAWRALPSTAPGSRAPA